MLIVTLSSIPPRFAHIGPTLQSLLTQTVQVDAINLYIPIAYRRFPDWDGTLPKVPDGVQICRVDTDFGPATKVLPAVQQYRGQDVDILFCDDDRAYTPGWAQEFLAARRDHAGCAIAKRGLMADRLLGTTSSRRLQPRALARNAGRDFEYQIKRLWRRLTGVPGLPERRLFRRSGYIDMFEGCSGVLVRPEFFDDAAFEIPDVAWRVDDVWLSGMLAKNNVPIWLIANTLTPANTAAQTEAPLAGEVIDGKGRNPTNKAAARYLQRTHGVWLG